MRFASGEKLEARPSRPGSVDLTLVSAFQVPRANRRMPLALVQRRVEKRLPVRRQLWRQVHGVLPAGNEHGEFSSILDKPKDCRPGSLAAGGKNQGSPVGGPSGAWKVLHVHAEIAFLPGFDRADYKGRGAGGRQGAQRIVGQVLAVGRPSRGAVGADKTFSDSLGLTDGLALFEINGDRVHVHHRGAAMVIERSVG